MFHTKKIFEYEHRTNQYLSGIILVLLLAFNIQAQMVFQKLFDSDDSDFGQSIIPTEDEGYIATGVINVAESSVYYPFLMKLNPDFTMKWFKTYEVPDCQYIAYVQPCENGTYILAGNHINPFTHDQDIYLMQVDQNGEIITFDNLNYEYNQFLRSLRQTSDGGFLIGGRWADDGFLMKIDQNLNLVWYELLGGYDIDVIYSGKETINHGIIAAGYTYSYGAGDCDILLIKLNTDGEVEWSEAIGGIRNEAITLDNAIFPTHDHGIIIAGYTNDTSMGTQDILIIKVDESGQLQWAKTYGGDGNDVVMSIQETSDYGFVFTGFTTSFSSQYNDGFLIKTDSIGTVDWLRIYGGDREDRIDYVQQVPDSGFILFGRTESFETNLLAAYLMKTTSIGASGCNDRLAETITMQPEIIVNLISTLSVERHEMAVNAKSSDISVTILCDSILKQKVDGNLPESFELNQNYPNPFNPGTKIEYSLASNTKVSLKIYNNQGQQVRILLENEIQNRGKYLVEWNGTDDNSKLVASGAYFYQLETDDMVKARKMIYLK